MEKKIDFSGKKNSQRIFFRIKNFFLFDLKEIITTFKQSWCFPNKNQHKWKHKQREKKTEHTILKTNEMHIMQCIWWNLILMDADSYKQNGLEYGFQNMAINVVPNIVITVSFNWVLSLCVRPNDLPLKNISSWCLPSAAGARQINFRSFSLVITKNIHLCSTCNQNKAKKKINRIIFFKFSLLHFRRVFDNFSLNMPQQPIEMATMKWIK